jgi:hypothetical protein
MNKRREFSFLEKDALGIYENKKVYGSTMNNEMRE